MTAAVAKMFWPRADQSPLSSESERSIRYVRPTIAGALSVTTASGVTRTSKKRNGGTTSIVNVFVSLNEGRPLSVTRTVTGFWLGAVLGPGVQVKIPSVE